MTAVFKALRPGFAAEVTGYDFATPPDAAMQARIVEEMDEHAVCVFRTGGGLADSAHLAFGRAFGPLMRQKMQQAVSKKGIRLGTDELVDVGNLDETGNIFAADDPRRAFQRGNLLWHTDVSFDPVRASYSILAGHVMPPAGADTEFADMRAAYDALSDDMKERIAGLSAEHSVWHSRVLGGMPDVSDEVKATRPATQHPLVQVNPRTGRKSLYMASHASHIVGWPVEEGRTLLGQLMAHATQRWFVYRHVWRNGDVVMWDNLQTMHRGTPFDDTVHPRDMRRVTVLEGEPAPV